MKMERELQKLNWLAVQKLVPKKIDTIILPVGTVEAHGSSCIGTDNYIPADIALGIADRLNALVAPVVNYGITRSLYRYPGGSTIRPETFQLYIREILDSFVDSKFHNVFVLNGHGGNNSSLKQAAIDFHQQRLSNIAVIHWWELCAEMTAEFFGHAGGHAGTDETAYVHAMDPDFVDEKRNSRDLAYTFEPGADVYPVPGTVLLYKVGEGYPEYNLAKAKKYRQKVIETVGDFSESVLKRWRKFGL
jgi:creatinine amidohydrolase